MSSKIDGVPRELLEVIANSSERTFAEINAAIQQAREILAAPVVEHPCPVQLDGCDGSCAPVVERQPVEVLGYSVVGNRYAIAATKGEIIELHEGYADHMIELVDRKHVTCLQAELAELQATIARLKGGGQLLVRDRDDLKAEIERLKGGQGELVEVLLLSDCVEHLHRSYGSGYFGTEVVQLYASQPAPVSVPFPGYPPVPEDRKLPAQDEEPIVLESVAVVREGDDGLYLEWTVEGGIAALEVPGTVLFVSDNGNDLCAEDGSCEVYLAPVDLDATEQRGFIRGLKAEQAASAVCDVPPEGWSCSREKGHDGPCAASPSRTDGDPDGY